MKKIEEEIRTKAWIHYVASCIAMHELQFSKSKWRFNTDPIPCCFGFVFGTTDTSRVNLLQDKTDIYAQNWSRYRAGRTPDEDILKQVEREILGSLQVFKKGPEGEPLWTALWSNDEYELWNIVKSISHTIQLHQALGTKKKNIYDYVLLESTKIYFPALTSYFEGLIERNNRGLMVVRDLAVLIAAFRLGQFRREAATYQDRLGRCLESSLVKETAVVREASVVNILRGYGVYEYLLEYVEKLIPHSEDQHTKIQKINREDAILDAHKYHDDEFQEFLNRHGFNLSDIAC